MELIELAMIAKSSKKSRALVPVSSVSDPVLANAVLASPASEVARSSRSIPKRKLYSTRDTPRGGGMNVTVGSDIPKKKLYSTRDTPRRAPNPNAYDIGPDEFGDRMRTFPKRPSVAESAAQSDALPGKAVASTRKGRLFSGLKAGGLGLGVGGGVYAYSRSRKRGDAEY